MTKLPTIGSIIVHESHRRRIRPETLAYVIDAIRTFETEKSTRITYFGSPFNETAKKFGQIRVELGDHSFEDDEKYGPNYIVIGHKDNL